MNELKRALDSMWGERFIPEAFFKLEINIHTNRLGKAKSLQSKYTAINLTDHIATFVLRYRPLGPYPRRLLIYTPKDPIEYLQAQGIAPLARPRRPTTPIADPPSDECDSSPEILKPDEAEQDAKIKCKAIKEERKSSEEATEDDDDIKALLVCDFRG